MRAPGGGGGEEEVGEERGVWRRIQRASKRRRST